MALSKSFSPSDRTRFARLALIIVEELTPILRDVIENEISHNLIFNKVKANDTLFKKLQKDQLVIIQNAHKNGYSDFDITLLYTLLRNLCPNIPSPTQGWGISKMPSQGETSLGDDIERIRLTKNNLYSHASTTSIPQTEFNDNWSVIYSLCQRMGKNLHKNYIKSLEIAQHRPLDEELERKWMEKIKESAESDKNIFEVITKMATSMRRIEKGLFTATVTVDAKLKDPAKKGLADFFLETTSDLLNYMVDCINEVTTEDEINEIYDTVEKYFEDESNEITRESIQPFFDKLKSKMKNYANQRVRKIHILARFTKFVITLRKMYCVDIHSNNGSLVLKLIFFSEEGYALFNKDFGSGKIGKEILDLLLYPSYLACFGLQPDDLIILLNDQVIHHDTGDRTQFGGLISEKVERRSLTMAEDTHSAQQYIECDNCEKNPANFLCKTCDGHLCETCKIEHGEIKLTKNHKIIVLTLDKKDTTEHIPCFVHTTKKLECYCIPCQMPVCTECLIETHNGHKVKSLSEVYDKMRGELQEEKMEIETILLPRYQDLLSKENAKAVEVSKRVDEVQRQIEVHTKNVVRKVNMIKEERVQDLREKEQEAQKRIADTKTEIETKIKKLNSINEDISINLGVSQETAFLLTLENRKIEEMRKLPCSSDFYVENFRPGDLDEIINEGKFGDSLKFLSTEDIKKSKKEKRETPIIFSGDIDE